MAKVAGGKTDKKKKKSATAEVGGLKIKVKGAKKKGNKQSKPKERSSSGFEALARLAEHPIVADLIAVGATAAVAALAESRGGKRAGGAAKNAGKAAAAAIGRRLVDEFQSVKEAAAEAAKKT